MSAETRNRIISEALQLFMQNGVKVITMDEIANHIGISKRTLYENFKDKEELLTECILYNKEKMDEKFNDFFNRSSNAIELLALFVIDNRKSIVNYRTNFVLEVKKYHPAVFENAVRNFKNSQKQRCIEVLQLGVEQGVFRKDLNFEIIFNFLQAGFLHLLHTDNKIKDKYSIGEIFEESISFCVRGIVTEYGINMLDEILEKNLRVWHEIC
ncbi:TetR family transcriptional regulator [Bacteroidia bacterium]|nr:TetR family transcriptional regulator [Bacteroidia bacterium]